MPPPRCTLHPAAFLLSPNLSCSPCTECCSASSEIQTPFPQSSSCFIFPPLPIRFSNFHPTPPPEAFHPSSLPRITYPFMDRHPQLGKPSDNHQYHSPDEDVDDDHADQCHDITDQLESLSFSDLPVTFDGGDSKPADPAGAETIHEHDDDFEFGSLAAHGPINKLDANMCAADDIFFRWRTLPLRHSISNDGREYPRTPPRSESMDHASAYSSGFRSSSYSSSSSSSRSNSTGSRHASSSSSLSSAAAAYRISSRTTGKSRNPFHSFPSPSPRILGTIRSAPNKKSSTFWEFLRLGLVRAPPEMGLPDLKARRSTDYMKSGAVISRSSSSNSTDGHRGPVTNAQKTINDSRNGGGGGGGIFGGCKFSVWTVDPVPSKPAAAAETRGTKLGKQQRQGKRSVVSRQHRAFEWLKVEERTHAGVLDSRLGFP